MKETVMAKKKQKVATKSKIPATWQPKPADVVAALPGPERRRELALERIYEAGNEDLRARYECISAKFRSLRHRHLRENHEIGMLMIDARQADSNGVAKLFSKALGVDEYMLSRPEDVASCFALK